MRGEGLLIPDGWVDFGSLDGARGMIGEGQETSAWTMRIGYERRKEKKADHSRASEP